MKKVVKTLALMGLLINMFTVPVMAQGDPVESEETQTFPENPETAPVQEDDHTPLSYDGTGTVIDNVLNGSKQFYTIATDAGNVFYLIIDLDKENNNVYFLDTTKERDLLALAEKAEEEDGTVQIKEEETPLVQEPKEPEVPQEPEPEQPKKSGNASLIMVFILIGLAGVGVIFYYWVYKPKKDQEEAEEFEEAYQFEDEQETSYDDTNAFD